MDKNLTKRLMALVLTGGILLSSTGVYTALATAESTTSEYTSALADSTEEDNTASGFNPNNGGYNPNNQTTSTTETTTSKPVETTTEKPVSTTEEFNPNNRPVSPETEEFNPNNRPTTVDDDNELVMETLTKPVADNEAEETTTSSGNTSEAFWVGVNGAVGEGTEANPWKVSSVEHFLRMNEKINDQGNANKYFQLTATLDFSDVTLNAEKLQELSSLGGGVYSIVSVDPALSSNPDVFFVLKGSGNYSIKNVTIEVDDLTHAGVFGYLNSSSRIEDVFFDNIVIKNTNTQAMATGLVLKNEGTIKGCNFSRINVSMSESTTQADSFMVANDSLRVYTGAAGVVVDNMGSIDLSRFYDLGSNPLSEVTVTSGRSTAGALIAQNRGSVNKIRANKISISGKENVGGLVGKNLTARSSSSAGIYYAEIVELTYLKGSDNVGGIAGQNSGKIQRSKVSGVYNSSTTPTVDGATIILSGNGAAGGIVGYNSGDVRLCSALNIGAYISSTEDTVKYGGIAGYSNYTVTNCVATGSTNGAVKTDGALTDIERYVGGIVGYTDASDIIVQNSYALVRILDSKADLGAIVGFGGDASYKNGYIKNNFYSSIISTRPSTVSYGAAGVSEGDLVFSKPYAVAHFNSYVGTGVGETVEIATSQFSFSGWSTATFDVIGNFTAKNAPSNVSITEVSSVAITYKLTALPKNGTIPVTPKTQIFYEVDITLPTGIGFETSILSKEPMELGVLNAEGAAASHGTKPTGAKGSEIYITGVADIWMIEKAPAAHFIASDDSSFTATLTDNHFSYPITFWGSLDMNDKSISYGASKPLFKGIYGSRDDSLSIYDSATHTSKSADSEDKAANLDYGVIKNLTLTVNGTEMSNIFGNICNATVKNISVNISSTPLSLSPLEENTGFFAKAVYGNSYIYGCYVESRENDSGKLLAYSTNGLNSISGFIGTIDAEKALIDNCGAKFLIEQSATGSSNNAVFVGKIKSLDGAIINTYATGGVKGDSLGSNNYIFAGEVVSSSTQIHNCYYSPSDYYTSTGTYKGVIDGIRRGAFTGTCKNYSFVTQNANGEYVDTTMQFATDTGKYIRINAVSNINKVVFPSDAIFLDTYFTVNSSDTTNLTTDAITLQDGFASVAYTFSGGANTNANLTVKHNATGLTARLSVYNSSDLQPEGDYYLIKTPIDLYYIAENLYNQSEGQHIYLSAKFKIAADIDMTGYTIEPLGTMQNPFQGEFIAGQDSDGEYFTVSNLSYDGYFPGFFGYVKNATIVGIHLDNITVTGLSNAGVLVNTVQGNASISDCKVTNSTVSAPSKTGAIVGLVSSPGSGDTSQITSVIDNCTVENTFVTSTKSGSSPVAIGGVVGSIGDGSGADNRSANITNCTVSNCQISADGYQVGGIVGYADHYNNTIVGCTVTNSNVYSTDKTISKNDAFLGGIAGFFGGQLIDNCIVDATTVSGSGAAGIVTNLMNLSDTTSTISNCTVTNSNILAENVDFAKFAGGIMSIVSPVTTYVYNGNGDKVVTNCKISADSTVKSAVAGGIIGNVDTFNGALTVDGCTNLGTIETTGRRGSTADAAGGIIGRIATLQNTDKININGCLSQGTLKGVSVLGGIIGVHTGKTYTGTSNLITNSYVTTAFSSTNLAVTKGLIIGNVGSNNLDTNRNVIPGIANAVVYSSLNNAEPLFGNGVDAADADKESMVYDMQLGEDQTSGLTLNFATSVTSTSGLKSYFPYNAHAIVGYENETDSLGKNSIQLKTNFNMSSTTYEGYGTKISYSYAGTSYEIASAAALSNTTLPRFKVDNTPNVSAVTGVTFKAPTSNVFQTDTSETKIKLGAGSYNRSTQIQIQTFDKKCQAEIYTIYTGSVNGEDVNFKVGFTVIVKGIHAFDGDGTQDNPFIIRDAEDLLSIKQHHDAPVATDVYVANPDYYYAEGTYYEVVNDINMTDALTSGTSTLSFAPIGNKDAPFKATISSTNGSTFKISGIKINDPQNSSDYAYYTEYGATPQYSTAFGVFGYTDGATITNLEFENTDIVATPDSNDAPGLNVGGVVGYAKNTTISNVKVTGATKINIQPASSITITKSAGGVVGYAGENVKLSNVSVIGLTGYNALISSTYAVGGIVGSSESATGVSITNAHVENVDVENKATSGKSVAGAVAGIFTGTVSGSYVDEIELDENNQPITVSKRNPLIVNNVNVSGNVVGGVVGTTSELTQIGLEFTQKISIADVSNVNLTVSTDSETNIANGVAGGILAQTGLCYAVGVEDCTVDKNTVITTGITAGGIVGKFNGQGAQGSDIIRSSLSIKDCKTYAKITQEEAPKDSDVSVKYTSSTVGVGGILGLVAENARVMNEVDNTANLKIYDSTAGGEVSGTYNVGGIVGQIASIRPAFKLTESVVSNCIVAAKISATPEIAVTRIGVIFGSVESNTYTNQTVGNTLIGVFPAPGTNTSIGDAEYIVDPVDKVFYSSYTSKGVSLYGKSEINNYQGTEIETGETDDEGNPVYKNLFAYKVYDINKLVYYYNNKGKTTVLPIGLVPPADMNNPASAYQFVGTGAIQTNDGERTGRYNFSDSFVDSVLTPNGGSGSPFGFTLAGENFVLTENGVTSSNTDVFTVAPNEGDTERPYKISCVDYKKAYLEFNYTNGLTIAIEVLCGVDHDGTGTEDDPIIITEEDEAVFRWIVPMLPNYYFKQTGNLDFTDEAVSAYGEIDGVLTETFGGNYNGGGFSINGLTITGTNSDTQNSIFGTVAQVIDPDTGVLSSGSIHDVTFTNCTLVSESGKANVGLVASEVKNNASITNVKVQDSVITAAGEDVGGIVGEISGPSILEKVSVEGSTITSSKGSVGGIAGVMSDASAQILGPAVLNSTILSGSDSGSSKDDIAGGIVAEAIGTIVGVNKIDETGAEIENEYEDAVSGVKVQAAVSGGAVGATYRSEFASDNIYDLNVNNIRIVDTDVIAKSANAGQTGMAASGLLGRMGVKTNVNFNNSYVKNDCKVTSDYTAGGAVGITPQSNFAELNIIDTECYAEITVTQAQAGGQAFAGGLIGYINASENIEINLNNITMNGSVAGGKIKAIGAKAYAGGAIGRISDFVETVISSEFFVNGVLSAEVSVEQGNNTGIIVTDGVQNYAKFIAGYNDVNFPTDETAFKGIFHDNYYSSYPQSISFFPTADGGTDETVYTNIIKGDLSNIDVNQGANLMLSKDQAEWNRVSIIGNGGDVGLFGQLNTKVIYGSADGITVTKKISNADLNAVTIESANGDVTLQGAVNSVTDDGVFSFTVHPINEGAGTLIVPYTCGLKTTAPIICVKILGGGMENNPFLIENATHLYIVGSLGTQSGSYFRQVNDIDLTNTYNENGTNTNEYINYNSGKGFAPIGSEKAVFKGNYDGQGYKITGIRINRNEENNVGLFGYTNEAVIKNIHLELMPSDGEKQTANGIVGKENVGGLVGRADNTTIENCSVAIGNVTGVDSVGGLVGTASNSKILNCFTQSDVNAFGNGSSTKPYAAGIVANIISGGNGAYVKGCFASGSVYATPYGSGTDFSNAAGIVGYLATANSFILSDCLFTGSTSGGYGILANAGGVNMEYTVSNCIDAGTNVAMGAGDEFTSLTHKPATNASAGVTFSEIYYDNALLKVNEDNINALNSSPYNGNIKGEPTSKLTSNTEFTTNWDSDWALNWTANDGFYPTPKVSNVTVVTYDAAGNATGNTTAVDSYSQAYARLTSLPIQVSESEEMNDSSNSAYGKGIVYPVTLLTNIDSNKVTYSSSIFDPSDTVPYPENYDTNLYGIGENKNVDLLFEDKSTGYTSVYRNIFDTTKNIVSKTEPGILPEDNQKNTRINAGASKGTVFENGEAYYNTQVPQIDVTVTIGGVEVHREIKIPLSYGSTYPIATQRQLFALGMAANETAVENSKFCNYYGEHYNYKLITDIDCTDSEIAFNPIGYGTANGYTGQFDGSGHKIIGLTINKALTDTNPVGLFARVSTDFGTAELASVKNLTLENCSVSGGNMVGTLVGHVKGEEVTIENCHVTGVSESDADGNVTVVKGVVNGSGEYLGGLIGKVDFPSDKITGCSASNSVIATVEENKVGKASAVGGLIGYSSGTVDSCYATGNVIVEELRPYQSGVSEPVINGVGGLIGVVSNAAGDTQNSTVTSSFASGNIEVKEIGGSGRVTREKNGIGGFIGYLGESSVTAVSQCFSGGNVEFGAGEVKPVVSATNSNYPAMVGVGGFIGITNSDITYCYSSAAVTSEFGSMSNTNGTYGVGTGGVVGIARDNVSNVYSSGSVSLTYTSAEGNGYNDIGGTIGTTMETSAVADRCFFDMWTNSDPNLTSVGGKEDTNLAGSRTTLELTATTAPAGFAEEGWGYAENAYPYLTSLLTADADPDIKVNSILSVICVNINDADVSAKQGLGITMALTVPTTFKYSDTEEYTLNWSGATLDKETNQANIKRTRNTAEYVDVTATIDGLEEHGSRVYRRLCADMRGTYEQPYLVGSVEDLNHVNMSTDEFEDAVIDYPEFYGQWATPLGEGNNQIEGTVHYRLSGNIDAQNSTRKIPTAPESYTYSYTELDENGAEVTKNVIINYKGFNLAGNEYSIKNINSDGYYIANVDENSTVSNIIFDNLKFAGTENFALVSNNKGQLIDVYVRTSAGDAKPAIRNAAGLVINNTTVKDADGNDVANSGIIDGCVVDVTLYGAYTDVGVMAVNNSGTIKNSATAGTVKTAATNGATNVAAFVVNNSGTITSCFSMADIDIMAGEGGELSNVSGFASINSGIIENVYTRTAINNQNELSETSIMASLVGTVEGNATVKNSYSIGLLGHFNEDQDSIVFGKVPTSFKADEVFVDKAIAGQKSLNSFKYAASTQSLLEMKQMPENAIYDATNNPTGAFVKADVATNTFPQLSSIVNAVNTAIVDENGEPIEIENGTVIRNYDAIKAYSEISSMALKTSYGQYADRLAADSSNTAVHVESLNSLVSSNQKVDFLPSDTEIISIENTTDYKGFLKTAKSKTGSVTLTASYRLNNEPKLTRSNIKVEPKLYIDVATTTEEPVNPNFGGGLGTKTRPYLIDDADSLQSLVYYGSDSTLYYELKNDIDMTGYEFEQIPIFSGRLNEGSSSQFAIENLESTGGIFAKVEQDAVINNIAIAGATITSNGKYTGALADEIDGATVTNCVVSANVESNYTEEGAATGVLAGMIHGDSTIDSVVTTGNTNAKSGAVGGVAGWIEGTSETTMSNVVSTANVPNLTEAGGIVGTMGVNARLNNVLYGGIAKGDTVNGIKRNGHPIVAVGGTNETVTNAYYDNQLNSNVVSETLGQGLTTARCNADLFNSAGGSFTQKTDYYPIPSGVNAADKTSSFAKTVDLASLKMVFYNGANNGKPGVYTSMVFSAIQLDSIDDKMTVEEENNTNYFDIQFNSETQKWIVKSKTYDATKDPSIIISLPNGATRTMSPSLVRIANVTYTIEDPDNLLNDVTYGVLIRNPMATDSVSEVNAISDFTKTEGGEGQALDSFIVAINGFYIDDMLPKGYAYEVSGVTLNGKDILSQISEKEGQIFVDLTPTEGDSTASTLVNLTLKVVKETKPWGVQSKNSTIN